MISDLLICLLADSRAEFPTLDDICWIKNDVISDGKKDSESPSIPFQSHKVDDDYDSKKCARGFDSDSPALAWDCDKKTNLSRKDSDEYLCSEDEISYVEDKSELYKSDFVEREGNSVRDYPFPIHEDIFQVRDTVLCDDYFSFGYNISNISFKPFLQSCSTRNHSLLGRLASANHHSDDIFWKQRNHVNLLDQVDVTKDKRSHKTEFSGSSEELDLITNAYSLSKKGVIVVRI